MTTTAETKLECFSCWCGAPMALPVDLVRNARKTGQALYCPATGHTFGWDSENDKLRKHLEGERARNSALRDQLAAADRHTATLKDQLSKGRKRAAAGVCPCCQRSFVQLARHMATKHPDYGESSKVG